VVGVRGFGEVGFRPTSPRHYRLWLLRVKPHQPNPVTFVETRGVARTFEAPTPVHRRPALTSVYRRTPINIKASLSSHPSSHPADLNLICLADLNLICSADLNLTLEWTRFRPSPNRLQPTETVTNLPVSVERFSQ
jgi:hypothetical protein